MIIQGDSLEILKTFQDNSFDSLITDPPAGISFLNEDWDHHKGGRLEWINWLASVLKECLRVLKPGAHGLVWALPRTSHWTMTACEEAGFEIRDVVTHIFGSGFPKSQDISKAIDKMKGLEREVGDAKPYKTHDIRANGLLDKKSHIQLHETIPACQDSKDWQGFGTALKPSCEYWVLIRKPLDCKTIVENVLKWGVGAIDIDGCRVKGATFAELARKNKQDKGCFGVGNNNNNKAQIDLERGLECQGRWPANFILSHNIDCECEGVKEVKGTPPIKHNGSVMFNCEYSSVNQHTQPETIPDWQCTPGCPVDELGKQSGWLLSSFRKTRTYNMPIPFSHRTNIPRGDSGIADEGTAARYFYQAKPSPTEKNKGCEDYEFERNGYQLKGNPHPTVKSIGLMKYLIKLVTPKKGMKVLDPFAGSGTTGIVAMQLDMDYTLIDQCEEYCKIAEMRIKAFEAEKEVSLF